jgi:hypothetical protein
LEDIVGKKVLKFKFAAELKTFDGITVTLLYLTSNIFNFRRETATEGFCEKRNLSEVDGTRTSHQWTFKNK